MAEKPNLIGLELTTMHTSRAGRMLPADCLTLHAECPRGQVPDTGIAETVARLLGWPEDRIDDAITDGLKRGLFVPRG